MPAKQFERGTANVALSRSKRFGSSFSADVYADLRFSPQYDRTFEAQQGFPVDGSNKLLRQLSPFTISLLPPLALSNVPEQTSLVDSLRQKLDVLALNAENVFNLFLDSIQVPQVGTVVETGAIENSDLTPHFTFSEFLKSHAIDPDYSREEILANIRTLAGELEKAKLFFESIQGGPVSILIISGYRPPDYNDKIEGKKNSMHMLGKAADIVVSGFSPTETVAILNELMDSGSILQGGLGYYPDPGDGFTHYDIRGTRTRWQDEEIDEGTEIKTIKEAVGMLPPGPLPSERARLSEEAGYSSPLQRRTVPAAPPPSIPLLDGATSVNTWQEAKDARTRASLNLLGSDIGGFGSNRTKAEVFIAGGLAQTNERGAFLEPGIADRLVAVDIASQLDTILKVPPLTLLINPASFSLQYTRIHQFSQRTRNGFLYQAWGEEQPTLTFSGTIGAFIAGDDSGTTGPITATPTGVQFASKRNSASYQNLMALLGFYKHAGYIYDTVHKTNAHHMVGALAIEYDQWVYVGHMNSFNWGYDQADSVQGKIAFDIEFTVSQMFDNHTPTESIAPLRSITDSMSSPGNVIGGVAPAVDVTSTSQLSAEETTEALLGSAWAGTTGARSGGTVEVPTGSEGYVQEVPVETPTLVIQGEGLPFCVQDPATGEIVGCFATIGEAQALVQSLSNDSI